MKKKYRITKKSKLPAGAKPTGRKFRVVKKKPSEKKKKRPSYKIYT